jgi:hypothetical protein
VLTNGGLVGHWSFDGKYMNWATNQALDSSGQNNNGTLVNMSTTTSPTRGVIGQALQFVTTSSQYVQITRNIADDMSICAWIKTGTAGNNINHWQSMPIYDSEVSGISNDFAFGVDSNGKLMYGNGDGSVDRTINGNTTVTTNNWVHACVTRVKSSGAVAIYVNGVLDKSGTGGTTSLMGNPNARIGYGYDGPNPKYWNGTIDDVRIYNRALSGQEVQTLYNLGR